MLQSTMFTLLLIAGHLTLQVVVSLSLDPEFAFFVAILFAFFLGHLMGRISKKTPFTTTTLHLAAVLSVMFGIVPAPGDPYLLQAVLISSFPALLLGWFFLKPERIHWLWLLVMGILVGTSAFAPNAIGSQRVMVLCSTTTLVMAAVALRGQLLPWYRHLLVLLPWIVLEVFAGLNPDTLIVFWTFPVGFLFSLGAYLLVSFMSGFPAKIMAGAAGLGAAALYAFVWFNSLMFSSSFSETAVPYQIPFENLENLNGLGSDPGDYTGKVIYLDMWSIYCGACRPMFLEIERLYREYADNPKVAVVTLASGQFDKREKLAAFVAEQEFKFPVWYDAGSLVAKHFALAGVPVSFFALPDGRIVDFHQGFHPDLADMYWERVRSRLREFSGGI